MFRMMYRTGIVCSLSLAIAYGAKAEVEAEGFSHAAWTLALEQVVDEEGFVDYARLAGDPAALERYLQEIAETGPITAPELFPDSEDQLAYYINAYNALVFRGVLDLGPKIESVWGVSGTGYGFFVGKKHKIDGMKFNLRKLENKIIRAGFEDPRIHAALNCASRGCPRLPRQAFDPRALDAELDSAMAEFVGDERHCRLDVASKTVELSKIFDWFRSDFEAFEAGHGDGSGLIAYVNRYRAAEARIPEGFAIKFLPYDKSLNSQ